MNKTGNKNLKELISAALSEMEKAHYCGMYIRHMRNACMLLEDMAVRMGKDMLDDELSKAFIGDSSHFRTGAYSKSRFKRHRLCVQILRTYRDTGVWPPPPPPRACSSWADHASSH
jgi:hypothetical protein